MPLNHCFLLWTIDILKLLTCLTSHVRLLRSVVELNVFVFLSALSSFALWLFPLQVWIAEPWKCVMVWQPFFRLFVVRPQQRINRPVVSGSTHHRIWATSIFLCVWHRAQSFPEQGGQMVLGQDDHDPERSVFVIFLQSLCSKEKV